MRVAVVISGEQIRSARERAGLTQSELGQQVGVSMRTVGNWERGESVPRNREAAVRAVLAGYLSGEPQPAPLTQATDAELLAEIARRFARGTKYDASNVREIRVAPTVDYSAMAADDHSYDDIEHDQLPHDT